MDFCLWFDAFLHQQNNGQGDFLLAELDTASLCIKLAVLILAFFCIAGVFMAFRGNCLGVFSVLPVLFHTRSMEGKRYPLHGSDAFHLRYDSHPAWDRLTSWHL